jgi:hypothetical protein
MPSAAPNPPVAALPAERVHTILRGMSEADWSTFNRLLHDRLTHLSKGEDIDVLERLFRKQEAIGGQVGGTVLRMVQAISSDSVLLAQLHAAHEQMRARVRLVFREMSDADWAAFKTLLEQTLSATDLGEGLRVLELVFRIGESISNIEVAAAAMMSSGPRLLQPEVARKNALMRARASGVPHVDPEAAYLAAKQALDKAEQTSRRAQCTLAYRYVRPSIPYRHARSTVFKFIDAVLEAPVLMARVGCLESQLTAVQPVSREQMRWALHRMPNAERMQVIKLIPLNTVLMFQNGDHGVAAGDLELKAARDRRLACDIFVRGQSEHELADVYRLALNAVKNAVGVILQALIERPLARQFVNDYLARVAGIEPMTLNEVRVRIKRLTAEQRAAIVNAIPGCAWKQRDVMPMHKHLFLDYISGEWVLGRLVDYYNLEKSKRLTGTFKIEGRLTVRGASAAIEGILMKIAEEPMLRQRLRQRTASAPFAGPQAVEPAPEEPSDDELLPPAPGFSDASQPEAKPAMAA